MQRIHQALHAGAFPNANALAADVEVDVAWRTVSVTVYEDRADVVRVADVTLPEKLPGSFTWRGKTVALRGGALALDLKGIPIVPFQPYFAEFVNVTVGSGSVTTRCLPCKPGKN